MDLMSLYNMVNEHYGYKIQMRALNTKGKEVIGILYESFVLKCNLDDRYGRFGAGIEIADGHGITHFLGNRCSLNSDEKSIKESLDIIDNYCRLRLPDKFLEAYDKAYR